MKSIKEQAKEYNGSLYTEAIFEAGANYVLDEIEYIIKADLGSYKFQLDRIKKVIEQLKK